MWVESRCHDLVCRNRPGCNSRQAILPPVSYSKYSKFKVTSCPTRINFPTKRQVLQGSLFSFDTSLLAIQGDLPSAATRKILTSSSVRKDVFRIQIANCICSLKTDLVFSTKTRHFRIIKPSAFLYEQFCRNPVSEKATNVVELLATTGADKKEKGTPSLLFRALLMCALGMAGPMALPAPALEELMSPTGLLLGTGIVSSVLFAGLVSGLTLGLMSLSPVDLEILDRSGTPEQREQVAAVRPLVETGHRLLVTLLICNALAMEMLPLFLDELVDPISALLISVTAVLFFGEIIPQAVCSKYGLQIGATTSPLVKVLMTACSPVAVPVAKLLDSILGPSHMLLFRRQELLALVALELEGGLLSLEESLIMGGAINLQTNPATTIMSPLGELYSLSADTRMDDATAMDIIQAGYSRIPVHAPGDKRDLLGLLVVKNLIVLNPADATPLSRIPLLPLNTVNATDSLQHVLNRIQETGVHTAIVVDEAAKPVGFLTLNDVMERLIQEKISDQTERGTEYSKFVQDILKVRASNICMNLHLLSTPQLLAIRKSADFSSFDDITCDEECHVYDNNIVSFLEENMLKSENIDEGTLKN